MKQGDRRYMDSDFQQADIFLAVFNLAVLAAGTWSSELTLCACAVHSSKQCSRIHSSKEVLGFICFHISVVFTCKSLPVGSHRHSTGAELWDQLV